MAVMDGRTQWCAWWMASSLGLACAATDDDGSETAALPTADAGSDGTEHGGDGSGPADGADDAAGSTTGDNPTTGDDPAPTGDDSGPAPTACTTASLFEPGMHDGITLDVDGVSRSYDLFVPTSYDPAENASLVVNFHGLLGSPSQQVGFSQFNNAAEAHGMLVAYPSGIGASFNAGVCCGDASSTGVDDVGFARALVADVGVKMCVDPRRVYATGMSNGGHMAHRLACEAADLFAATASVTGVLSLASPCLPSRPISIVQYHGTADSIVSYDGFPSVVPMMHAWAARNGCSAVSEGTFDQGDMHCQTWPGCDGGVEVSLCTVDDGGHCWPGNGSCAFGHSSTELHASEEIAKMFDAHPMP